MQFGIFLPNSNNGYVVSTAAPQYPPTYELNKTATLEAEKHGMEFALSMVKYRGFGGATRFWDDYLETFTLMAALAESTEKIQLYASIGILSIHPAITARMIQAIDDISHGRVGLNIVTGGWKPEYTQFGVWPGDHYYAERYEYAADYVRILRNLWEAGTATYEGKLWNLEDCRMSPLPSRRIPIVNAGQSPSGMRFTAEFADYSFLFAPLDRLKEYTRKLRTIAAEEFSRHVGVYGLYHLIPGETDRKARRLVSEIIANADRGAIQTMIDIQERDTANQGSGKFLREGIAFPPETGNVAFMGFPVICGSYETCAAELDRVAAEAQIDGIMLCFLDYVEGVREFAERIEPLLDCRKARSDLGSP
jgi:pyrimidine oxygenase